MWVDKSKDTKRRRKDEQNRKRDIWLRKEWRRGEERRGEEEDVTSDMKKRSR